MTTAHTRQDEESPWIERAAAGDANAFARLVQAYQGPVYNLCFRMLGSQEEAEDASQETFLRAYSHLHRYDPQRRFITWILSIASNHCIDRLRRRRFTWLSMEDTPLAETLAAHGESPAKSAERREQAAEIQGWIEQLDPLYRAPLILLYWHDLSYEEIADTMQLTVPAVKSRLHRARKQVAELILAEEARRESAERVRRSDLQRSPHFVAPLEA